MEDRPTKADPLDGAERCVPEDGVYCREDGPLDAACSWRPCMPGECDGDACSASGDGAPGGVAGYSAARTTGVPLTIVGTGRKVRLLALLTGRECAARLASLGLVPGAEIEVLRNAEHGPFMVAVKGSRVVLGRGVAQRVMVG